MRVMSRRSPPNDTEACGSEGSSFSSISTPTSTPTSTSDPSPMSMHALDAQGSSQHESASSADQLLPPPPPPLPPPPPPLPPSTPPPANHGVRKKRRVRSFFWKPIPEEKVRGRPNIWSMSVRQQQQYQIDVRSVEELFGQQEEGPGAATTGAGRGESPPAAGRPALIARSRSFRESSKDEISILDSKRGMNVGIFLKQFKKSNIAIVEDIRQGDGKIYGAELLKDLLKLLPDIEEVKKLQSFKGDPSKLTLVDNFMYQLIQIPRFEVRIEAMVLREEFFPSCAVMSRDIDVIHVATKELMNCEELHAILHLVLQAGNIMNAGGYAGNAVGFKLSSLLSLADTKANKPGMNLLHFVALEGKKKDEKLLKFPEKLQHVQSAARISVENIEMEFSSLYVRTRSLEEKVQGDQDLLLQLEPFLQSSVRTLQDLQRRRLDLRKEGNALIDFFCEDKDTFKLDEGFRIFQDFCLKFKKAVKDNLDRELKEVARQRRLRELEEKRFAWSAADQSGGFGRSSSESDMEQLTKEGLLDFFQQRSQSPHSPLGRSASARRHRHTVSAAAAERELQDYLELLGGGGGSDYSKFNSLPRSGRAAQRRTTPWLLSQDDNRELTGRDRPLAATSPRAETEPISPLVRYSTSGFSANEDPLNDNNNTISYSSVSEGSVLPRNSYVFQKTTQAHNLAIVGHMSVSVEKHLLVRVPQAFDLCSPNNNNRHTHFVHQGDVVLTDLEMDTPPPSPVLDNLPCHKTSGRAGNMVPPAQKGKEWKEEDEDNNSTVSSTTCDTTLPLDPLVSNKKPALYILDCTETDCSVAFDCSDIDSSPLTREGLTSDLRTLDFNKDSQENQQDPSSLSSNLESMSTNDQTISTSTNELSAARSPDVAYITPCAAAEEWDTDSCDTAEGRQVGEKAVQTNFKSKLVSKASKASGTHGIRMLTTSENQGMRKVVPITRTTRVGSHVKRTERGACQDGNEPHRPLRDQSTPARGRTEKTCRTPRHSSLPPDDSKIRSVSLTSSISRWARDSTPKKSSFRKPSAKPLRNIPKLAPEEKMCRSTMRALAQAQAQNLNQNLNLTGASSEVSGSQTLVPKITSEVPSFARNTVASSSRTKKELGTPSVPSTPSRSPSLLARTVSAKQNKLSPTTHATAPHSEDRPHGGSLRKVQSAKSPRQSSCCSDTPPPPPPLPSTREDIRKSNSFTEKSVQTKDSVPSSKSPKPSWK